jgi:GNAT superfamily N-acetyltransferase
MTDLFVIRPAHLSEVFAVVSLARNFHAAANMPFKFDAAHFSMTARAWIEAETALCLVLESGGTVCGVLMADVGPLPFEPILVAHELIFWIDPPHRGQPARRMLAEYEAWARDRGCAMIGLSSLNDARVARLYGAAGFTPCENNFIKMVD